MKQHARYTINFESRWLLFSAAMMGVAFFCQALRFLVLTKPQSITGGDLTLYLILPMVLELIWMVLVRIVKVNASGIFGIAGTLICILLAVQISVSSGAGYIVLAWVGYLAASGLFIMITGGFFPYKYFGMAFFALLFVVRFFHSGVIGLINRQDWTGLVTVAPGLCTLAAMLLFFGGITGVRRKR